MSHAYWLNFLGLGVVTAFSILLAASLLWRVGLWSIPAVERLHTVEGMPLGSRAHQIAARSGDDEHHLTFSRHWTFLVFGSEGCEPCASLLGAAAQHVATRDMRLVFVGDSDGVDCQSNRLWEFYRFDDEHLARRQWRAPVSPYFHVINPLGRVAAKGIASKPQHLDRLLALSPMGSRSIRGRGGGE